jgi:CBS domain-containing protein
MTVPNPARDLTGEVPATGGFDVGSLFPAETEVVSVAIGTSVLDALRIMVDRRFSQLPVVAGTDVD